MSCIVLLIDLRNQGTILQDKEIQWYENMTAREAISNAFSNAVAAEVADDLQQNVPGLMVSWTRFATGEHSDIGGVDALDWMMDNQSILAINYEDHNTTEQQIDKSSEWMLEIYRNVSTLF